MINNFKFNFPKNVIFEEGFIKRIDELFPKLNIKKPIIITDAGLKKLYFVENLVKSLKEKGVNFEIFFDIKGEPTDRDVYNAFDYAKNNNVDGVIGFGGGSSLDVAKVVSVLLYGKETLDEIYGVNKIKYGRIPLILIPTTVGTGSEATVSSVISVEGKFKNVVISDILLPDYSILDPSLVKDLPKNLVAYTGVDAITHAIEGYITKKNSNPLSKLFSKEALRLLIHNIVDAYNGDMLARANMLLGAMYAGLSFSNSSVAAVHGLAYPLGTLYHIPHGLSNAVLLIPILKRNKRACINEFIELYNYVYLDNDEDGDKSDLLVEKLNDILKKIDIPQKITELNHGDISVDDLVNEGLKQERLLVNNPICFDKNEIKSIYEEII